MNESARTVRRWANLAITGTFLTAIVTPFLAWIGGLSRPDIETTENRRTAPFPQVEVRRQGPIAWPRKKSLEAFPADFEAWFNDRLAFRHRMIQSYSLAKSVGLAPAGLAAEMSATSEQGLQRGSRPAAPVLVGRDGWLFYRGDGDLESYRCRQPFTSQELDEWQQTLEYRREWLAQRGIRYLVVIAPDKSTVYPEFLPAGVPREGNSSRLDQFLARLRDERQFDILDLRPELQQAKSRHPTYFHTDTHWNQFGAFVGYQQIMLYLRKWLPESRPMALTSFRVSERAEKGGDEARLLAWPKPPVDTQVELQPLQPLRARRIDRGRSGGHKWRLYVCRKAPLPRVLVLHDSFFLAAMPFFSEHWRRASYHWTFQFPYETIDRERPQVVVQEIVERFLIARPAARQDGRRLAAASRKDPDAGLE